MQEAVRLFAVSVTTIGVQTTDAWFGVRLVKSFVTQGALCHVTRPWSVVEYMVQHTHIAISLIGCVVRDDLRFGLFHNCCFQHSKNDMAGSVGTQPCNTYIKRNRREPTDRGAVDRSGGCGGQPNPSPTKKTKKRK